MTARWHYACINSADCRKQTMTPNKLEVARSRYRAAYEAYQKPRRPLPKSSSSGGVPSAEEVEAETDAMESSRSLSDALSM